MPDSAKLTIEITDTGATGTGFGTAPARTSPVPESTGAAPSSAPSEPRPAGTIPTAPPAGTSAPSEPRPIGGTSPILEPPMTPRERARRARGKAWRKAKTYSRRAGKIKAAKQQQVMAQKKIETRKAAGQAWRRSKTYNRRVARVKAARAKKQAEQDKVEDRQAGGKAWRKAKTRARRVARLKQRQSQAAAEKKTPLALSKKLGKFAATSLGSSARAGVAAGSAGSTAASFAGSAAAGVGALGEGAAAVGLAGVASVAAPAAIALGAVAAAAYAASEMVKSFVARGRELQGFNGQLAAASAQADIRSLQADIREAQELGPKMARMIELQSKADATFREIMLPVKEFLITTLNESLKLGLEVAPYILKALNKMLDSWVFKAKIGAMDDMIARIDKILAGADPGVDALKAWRDAADKMALPLRGDIGARPAAPVLAVPVIGP